MRWFSVVVSWWLPEFRWKREKKKKVCGDLMTTSSQKEMMFRTAYIHFCVHSSTYLTFVVDWTYVIYWTAKITAIALSLLWLLRLLLCWPLFRFELVLSCVNKSLGISHFVRHNNHGFIRCRRKTKIPWGKAKTISSRRAWKTRRCTLGEKCSL